MQVGDLIKVRYNEPTGIKVAIVTKILQKYMAEDRTYPRAFADWNKYAIEVLPVDEKTPFKVFPSEIIEVINEGR